MALRPRRNEPDPHALSLRRAQRAPGAAAPPRSSCWSAATGPSWASTPTVPGSTLLGWLATAVMLARGRRLLRDLAVTPPANVTRPENRSALFVIGAHLARGRAGRRLPPARPPRRSLTAHRRARGRRCRSLNACLNATSAALLTAGYVLHSAQAASPPHKTCMVSALARLHPVSRLLRRPTTRSPARAPSRGRDGSVLVYFPLLVYAHRPGRGDRSAGAHHRLSRAPGKLRASRADRPLDACRSGSTCR